MTLRSTGSDVNKGLEPPLFEEAELRGGGGVTATFEGPGGTTGDPLEGNDLFGQLLLFLSNILQFD